MKRAFTLIELLVVIAIIAILAALLIPALERARESAYRSVCASNIHQWYLGIEMAADSYDGYYPGIITFGQGPTGCVEYKADDYANGKPFMHPYGERLPEYIRKEVTLCPGAPARAYPLMPYDAEGCEWYQAILEASRRAWQYNAATGMYGGITDYAIRVGFGSTHGGIDPERYKDYDPDYYRGFHKCMYWRWSNGFVFNYRQSQRDAQPDSIMLMDRQRSPAAEPWDGGRYMLVRANHADTSGVGAAGCNILVRNGQVRWMDLTHVWAKADWSHNQYGQNGYAEGGYMQYVEDDIAAHW